MADTSAELAKPPAPAESKGGGSWDWLNKLKTKVLGGGNKSESAIQEKIDTLRPVAAQPEELRDPLIKTPNDPNPLTGAA